MIKLLLFCLLLTIPFWGCKKSDQTLSPVEVQEGGSTTYSLLSLNAVDITQHQSGILNVDKRDDGVLIYSSALVYPGDRINISYKFNYAYGAPADPTQQKTITYFYRGQKLGSNAVTIGDTATYTTSINIP